MILNVSGRTDIVAHYMPWFLKRYQEGYVDVRNPFYPKQVSRIYFTDVDAIMFCTKNPLPLLDHLTEFTKPLLLHVTLTPYQKEIEPGIVPSKKDIIKAIQKISAIIGKNRIVVRYDPIFLSDKYNIQYHNRCFKRLCDALDGYIETIIVSFIDDYKNVRKNKNILKNHDFSEDDLRMIGTSFSAIAKSHHIKVQTCFEDRNLVEYGFVKGECLSHTLAFQLTGRTDFKTLKSRKGNKCQCVEMVDIGAYNTCRHFCKYCYANFDESKVHTNITLHNPNSSILIGEIKPDDIIKIRKK